MLTFSGCAAVHNSRYVHHQESLESFAAFRKEFLSDTTFIKAETKEELPLLMSAEYAAAGVRRCAANVLRVHFLVLDIDRGTWEELTPGLNKVNSYSFIYYTTFSHDPEGQPKFRLLIELSRPVDITEWSRFWVRAVHHLGLLQYVDRKCADACHMYYVPGGDPEKYTAFGDPGPPLDVNAILELPLPEGETEPVQANYQEVLAEEDRGEIDQGLRDLWEARLQNLVDEIGRRPYPHEMYDLKSHAVFSLARGVPHIMDQSRLYNMVRNALNARYDRHKDHPNVEADRQKAMDDLHAALEDGKQKPYFPARIDEIKTHTLDEYGLRERLLDQHHEDLSWEETWKKWLVWTSKFWNIEAGKALVQERMIETILTIPRETDAHMHDFVVARETYERVKDDPDVNDVVRGEAQFEYEALKKRIEEVKKFAQKSRTRAKTSAGIDLASSNERVRVSHHQFNRDPWLINFENGTLDLRTGQLRPHNRRDYLTQIVPFEFDPTATCPTIDRFLDECMQGKKRLVDFLWQLLGYTSVGLTTEQILILNIGEGCNGKTTFMNLVLQAFGGLGEGSYAFNAVSENLLTAKGQGKHETWRMDMFGKRVVTAMEVEEGRTFAESLIKELTGSDPITGRRMRQDNWTYVPGYQLWLSANHLPHIRGTDEGIWRRIVVIPWEASFKGKEDRTLGEKLKAEIPGLWARVAREAVAWREKGLTIPREVVAASLRYRREQDPLRPFLEGWCLQRPDHFEARDLLWAAYLEHADASKQQVFHEKKRFYAALEKRFKPSKRRGVNGFKGLRLMTPQERIDNAPRTRLNRAQESKKDDEDDDEKFKVN